ncbi:MAG: PQQ-binding-like beta-propeller repeat protein [Acidobacteriota bacterium]
MGSRDSQLHAINPDGTRKWVFGAGGYVFSSPAIGPDGVVYFGSTGDKLFAVHGNSGDLAISSLADVHA